MAVVQGKLLIAMARLYADRTTDAAKRFGSVTENSEKISSSVDSTITKDGAVRSVAAPEVSVDVTMLMGEDDAMIEKIDDAVRNGKLMELWLINLAKKDSSGKYSAVYYQGYASDVEYSAPADGNVEVSFSFGAIGSGQKGTVTLTDAIVEEALYSFADVAKVTSGS